MRCFQHRETEAVGLCRACGRGACPDCAAEVEGGLACRGRCEDEVQATYGFLRRNRMSVGVHVWYLRYRATLFLFVASVAVVAALGSHPGREGEWVLFLLGGCFFLMSLLTVGAARRYAALVKPPRDGRP